MNVNKREFLDLENCHAIKSPFLKEILNFKLSYFTCDYSRMLPQCL